MYCWLVQIPIMLIGQLKTKRAYMNTEYMNTFHAEFVEMFIICLHKKN
jgi:hypothetical protein